MSTKVIIICHNKFILRHSVQSDNVNICSAIVRALASHGADLNLHGGSDGWTPLFYAAMAGK